MHTQVVLKSAGDHHRQTFAGIVEEKSTRAEAWVQFVDKNVCAFSFQTKRSISFSVDARARSLNGFTVARLVTAAGPALLDRRLSEIGRDSKNSYAFYVPRRGYQEVHQFNRNERCPTNALTLVSTAEPFRQIKPGDNDTICLLVPGDFVDQRALRVEDACARVVMARHGLPRLFCASLIGLESEAAHMTEAEFLSAAQNVSELGVLAIATLADLTCQESSVRACNLARVKRIIRRRASDPDLTLASIAVECGLSLRYLHKLFNGEGCTMNNFLKDARLQLARAMLHTAPSHTTVTDICFASGFSNASQFSTAFKRAFSLNPRDVLRQRRAS